MKYLLLLTALIVFAAPAHAQRYGVYDGIRSEDSSVFTFDPGDTLIRQMERVDTSGITLWKTGSTLKPFFSATDTVAGAIMTDTTQPYPKSANDWFSIKVNHQYTINVILTFRHKYETRKNMDGGIVEMSLDSGVTWKNALGDCNVDTIGYRGIRTTNFYTGTDTIYTGEKAFTGTSNGWMTSRVQLFWGFPMRATAVTSNCVTFGELLVRFRFVSDTVADTLDGWIIDEIKVEHDYYGSGVADITANHLSVYPNPSNDGIIQFPALQNEAGFKIEIRDVTGRLLELLPYQHQVDLGRYNGILYYKVYSPAQVYTGKILIE